MGVPDALYLSWIRCNLFNDASLRPLIEGIEELNECWNLLARIGPFPELHHIGFEAETSIAILAKWMKDGEDSSLLQLLADVQQTSARNTVLGLLTVLGHIVEYSAFIDSGNPNHYQNLAEQDDSGGIQGLCIGSLSALAIAYSDDKTKLAHYGTIALRLALCVGSCVDVDEKQNCEEATTCITARWDERQEDGFRSILKSHNKVC